MKKYYSVLERPKKIKEVSDGSTKTEIAGYRPPHIQVMELIAAGERLMEYRRELYDFGTDEPIDDNFSDPTREPNFDLSDAAILGRKARRNLRESAERKMRDENEREGRNDSGDVDGSNKGDSEGKSEDVLSGS